MQTSIQSLPQARTSFHQSHQQMTLNSYSFADRYPTALPHAIMIPDEDYKHYLGRMAAVQVELAQMEPF